MTSAVAGGYVPLNTRPLSGHVKLLRLVGSNVRVLDVGCSSGYLARQLTAVGCEVVGIERDETAAHEARAACGEVLVGDIESMELPLEPASFDVVLCGDLLEHLDRPTAVLERVRPLLVVGGRLVLSTPNVANWAMRLSLLFGRWRYSDRGILDRTHKHLFTRATLLEALDRAGYRVTEFDYTVPVPFFHHRTVDRLIYLVGGLRPSLFAYQFVVAASAK